jgi:hypothetical protein
LTEALLLKEKNSFTLQKQFADVIEGNDTAIILNDTNIGNVNNTVLDSVDVNVAEDCMQIPNSTVLYCP